MLIRINKKQNVASFILFFFQFAFKTEVNTTNSNEMNMHANGCLVPHIVNVI